MPSGLTCLMGVNLQEQTKTTKQIEVFYSAYIAVREHRGAKKDFPMYIMLPGEGGVREKCKTVAFLTRKDRQDGSLDPCRT